MNCFRLALVRARERDTGLYIVLSMHGHRFFNCWRLAIGSKIGNGTDCDCCAGIAITSAVGKVSLGTGGTNVCTVCIYRCVLIGEGGEESESESNISKIDVLASSVYTINLYLLKLCYLFQKTIFVFYK